MPKKSPLLASVRSTGVLRTREDEGPVASPPPGGGPSLRPTVLAVTVPHQEQDQWCWAAVSKGIADYYADRPPMSQCMIVSNTLDAECCASPGSSACNKPWYLDVALEIIGHYDRWVEGPLSMPQLRAELRAGRPVAVRKGARGVGHFVVVEGCDPDRGEVMVEDPWMGSSTMPYEALVLDDAGWSWTHTYFVK